MTSIKRDHVITRKQLRDVHPCKDGYKRVCKHLNLTDDGSTFTIEQFVTFIDYTEFRWVAELLPERCEELVNAVFNLPPVTLDALELANRATPKNFGALVVHAVLHYADRAACWRTSHGGDYLEDLPKMHNLAVCSLREYVLNVLEHGEPRIKPDVYDMLEGYHHECSTSRLRQ